MNSWQFTIHFVVLRKDYWFHYSNPAVSEEIHNIKTKEIQPGKKIAKRDRNKASFFFFKFLMSLPSIRSNGTCIVGREHLDLREEIPQRRLRAQMKQNRQIIFVQKNSQCTYSPFNLPERSRHPQTDLVLRMSCSVSNLQNSHRKHGHQVGLTLVS